MYDLLLLGGLALIALAVIQTVIEIFQTRAPRGGAISLTLGVVALVLAWWLGGLLPTPETVCDAWDRLAAGEFRL